MSSPCASSQARATCAGEASTSEATAWTSSTMRRVFPKLPSVKRGLVLRQASSLSSWGERMVPVRKPCPSGGRARSRCPARAAAPAARPPGHGSTRRTRSAARMAWPRHVVRESACGRSQASKARTLVFSRRCCGSRAVRSSRTSRASSSRRKPPARSPTESNRHVTRRHHLARGRHRARRARRARRGVSRSTSPVRLGLRAEPQRTLTARCRVSSRTRRRGAGRRRRPVAARPRWTRQARTILLAPSPRE
jgi:hypothetical protein